MYFEGGPKSPVGLSKYKIPRDSSVARNPYDSKLQAESMRFAKTQYTYVYAHGVKHVVFEYNRCIPNNRLTTMGSPFTMVTLWMLRPLFSRQAQ